MASGADNLDAGSTIVAEASAPLRAAIAVLRVSGPAAGEVCRFLTGRPYPAARRAVVRTLRAGPNGEELDQAMVIWLPGPGSFSGEDMLELHVHGGASVRAAVLTAILSVAGVRPAAPGEFSKRAFLNGRMDLTQAEAIADLVDAETVGQRRQALRQMAGALGGVFEDWRGRLLRALAHLEAVIDFSEEDLPADLAAEVRAVAAAVAAEMTVHLADQQIGERVREGLRVAVLGPPNVGKSSLINHLAARDIAIVSARAGTTRDVLEAHLDIAGLPVVMADTAGIRASGDDIELIGMARARAWAEGADLRVLVLDRAGLDGLQAVAPSADVVVVNKADLGPRQGQVPEGALDLSVARGEGVDAFVTRLAELLEARVGQAGSVVMTRARHRDGIRAAADALAAFDAVLGDEATVDLAAEELRAAVRAVGRVTGRVDVEDLLDLVFADFCIGK